MIAVSCASGRFAFDADLTVDALNYAANFYTYLVGPLRGVHEEETL